MTKKILTSAITAALASLSIYSAPVVAQTNVQIYGLIDYGYSLRHDRNQLGKDTNISKTNSRFDGGQSYGNRIGFKGVEDLGNGTKALFTLERGFALDTGSDIAGFNRQAYIGLTNDKWGTLIGGNVYTGYYTFLMELDPFKDGTVGRYGNLKEDLLGQYGGLFNPMRAKNTVVYLTPNWGGFNIGAAFSNNALADDSGISNAKNNTVYAIMGTYTGANWNIGLSYHYLAVGTDLRQAEGFKNVQNVSLGGAYDFNSVKVSAFVTYDRLSIDRNHSKGLLRSHGKGSISQTNFMLGAVAPFGKHAVKGSFNYSYNSNNQYGKAWQLAVGYDYNFSKRTNFYAAYSYIHNDKFKQGKHYGRYGVVNDAQNSGGSMANVTNAPGFLSNAGYQQGFQVGIKHSF